MSESHSRHIVSKGATRDVVSRSSGIDRTWSSSVSTMSTISYTNEGACNIFETFPRDSAGSHTSFTSDTVEGAYDVLRPFKTFDRNAGLK